jgi:type 1 glutamine amidotransferase
MELNQVSPLRPGAQPLLLGSVDGFPAEPVAWTFVRADGGRTFFTPLGHPEDFDHPAFQRLLLNGIRWSAGLPLDVR